MLDSSLAKEIGAQAEIFLPILERVSGEAIAARLTELASIGGKPIEPTAEQPVRFAANRLALSDEDEEARRTLIRPLMEEAGLEVSAHPLADIGVLPGKDREKSPLVLASHTDTVPSADGVDGVYGVMSMIEIIRAMTESGFIPDRDIIVLSYTGEESARFNSACFGSRSIFDGLTDDDLALRENGPDGKTLGEILGEEASEIVRQPIFGDGKQFKKPHAAFELHVEQNDVLDKAGVDLGIVENIAAAQRYKIRIGEEEPLEPEPAGHKFSRYFELDTAGIPNHSGATPMGIESRADGLVWTSQLLEEILKDRRGSANISIGDINIDESSMNKVPGKTNTALRISAGSEEEVEAIINELAEKIADKNARLEKESPLLNDGAPISLIEFEPEEDDRFFDPEKILPRQKTALMMIKAVEEICSEYADSGVVGTIGTYSMDANGTINLSLDVRGTEKTSRDSALARIQQTFVNYFQVFSSVDFGEKLVGSSDPVKLHEFLVKSMVTLAQKYEIGSVINMDSKAMHDIANAATAGVPSALIFVPSRDGIAHHPDAFTSVEQMERGARMLGLATLAFSQLILDPLPEI